ncbi:hypothetical protein [Bacillus manliponensis]|nr:hypothetical protein [Bacillus manliponensis]
MRGKGLVFLEFISPEISTIDISVSKIDNNIGNSIINLNKQINGEY